MYTKRNLFRVLSAATGIAFFIFFLTIAKTPDYLKLAQHPQYQVSSRKTSPSSLPSKSSPPLPPSAAFVTATAATPSTGVVIDQKLLLVTKGRSGSTFTSVLVREDQNVFYTYEPLGALGNYGSRVPGIMFPDEFKPKAYRILKAFLTCNFPLMNGTDFKNFQLRNSGPLAYDFYQCVHSVDQGYVHMECLLEFMRACQTKGYTFAKVIRFPMRWAEELLEDMPSLKILYLIRDPRAVLRSQARVFRTFVWPDGVEEAARGHCQELEEDAWELERLRSLFPGRVRVIRYEQGAMKPNQYAKDVYEFAALNFTSRTEDYLASLKRPDPDKESQISYSVHRSDPVRTMNTWRIDSGFDLVRRIDEICWRVYTKFGYLNVTSEEHLASEQLLVKESFPLKF